GTQIQPKTCWIISAMNRALVSNLTFPVWTRGFSSMIGFNLFLRQPFYLSTHISRPAHYPAYSSLNDPCSALNTKSIRPLSPNRFFSKKRSTMRAVPLAGRFSDFVKNQALSASYSRSPDSYNDDRRFVPCPPRF